MIARRLGTKLRALARRFPVVTVTGPRQAGKTTLCRALFPRHRYVSLEAPDTREYATEDPRGFLAELAKGAVIDEVQRTPALLSYLQEEVDARPRPGRFVLTGSANLGLLTEVSQTLSTAPSPQTSASSGAEPGSRWMSSSTPERPCLPPRSRPDGRAADFFSSLEELRSLVAASRSPRGVRARLVHGGDTAQRRKSVDVVPWRRVADTPW